MINGELMHKNATAEILQKCVIQEEGIKLLGRIDSGSCGNHAA